MLVSFHYLLPTTCSVKIHFHTIGEAARMHLVAPDVLQDAQGLSIVPCAAGILLGIALWFWGWRAHRFWLVFTATLAAGICGLSYGPTQGVQPIVAGLLLGVAAGTMVLDLVRVLAFAAGALVASLLAQQFAPGWNEPFLFCFFGGFLGLLLHRYWMMALFSFVGATLALHSALCMIDSLSAIDVVRWSQKRLMMLDVVAGVSTVIGFMIQFYFDRRRAQKIKADSSGADLEAYRNEPKPLKWWQWWRWPDSDRSASSKKSAKRAA